MTDKEPSDPPLDDAIRQLSIGDVDRKTVIRTGALLAKSARAAGAGAVMSGRWMADLVIRMAPKIPVRDLGTLREQYNGISGPALAGHLIRAASRASGAIGVASGAIVSAEEFAPPAWITIPFELVVETVAIAAIEMKLVAELQAVYNCPLEGDAKERSLAIVQAWADRRAVSRPPASAPGPANSAEGYAGSHEAQVKQTLGQRSRKEIMRIVRRRLLQRLGRNLSTLAPVLVGAGLAAETNRRATRALGESVLRDLSSVRRSSEEPNSY